MTNPRTIERRAFLKDVTAAGLVLAIGPGGVRRLDAIGAIPSAAGEFEPSIFLSIAESGIVTVVNHRSEMGQGTRTTLVMVVADELEADWKMVRVEQAIGDKKYGDQNTDGSSSIRGGVYEKFRQVGAVGRTMLEQAAAAEWSVPLGEVKASKHTVVHAKTGRSLGFGRLVARARTLPVPKDAPLKAAADFRFIGKRVTSMDVKDVVTGKAIYGQDATVPGMRIAVLMRPPVYGAKVASVDASAALAVRGVEKVLEIPAPTFPSGFNPLGGIAVVADSTWAAISGRRALKVTWTESPHDVYDSATYRTEIQAATRAPGTVMRDLGDAPAALGASPKRIEAEYYASHLSQAPMEPPAALANVTGDRCETWSCSQDPQQVQATVAAMTKLKPENVTAHVTLLGGGFGRKSKPDYVAEAAWLSQSIGKPVKVVWTREDDIRNGFVHTVCAQRLEATLDASGKIAAWRHRIASPPIFAFGPGEYATLDELSLGVLDMPYDIPNVRVEVCKAPPHVRVGWFRSVNNIPHAFAIASFMDELAHAAGKDPLAFLLESLGGDRHVDMTKYGTTSPPPNYGPTWAEHPNDTSRHRRVLETVAREAKWGRAMPKGEGLGIAVHRSFLTYVAAVVHARVSPQGAVTVPRVDVAMDCGFAVNPDRVRSQCEGAVGMALSSALMSELTYAKGAAVQSNFNDYRVVRMTSAPREIHVYLVDQGGPIGGVGEPGVPPIAPALANAIFAATGKRIRSLPIGPQLAG